MKQQNLNIGLLQYDIAWELPEQNLDNIESIIEKQNTICDIVVLPELFTTGFTMNVNTLAEPMNGATMQRLLKISRKHNIAIAGSILICENKCFYNRFVFVKPDGTWCWYDKHHLFRMGDENQHFTRGNKRVIIDYKGFRIQLLVCYDLRFPVWSRNRNDYDVIIYAANWPVSRQDVWNTLLKARAIENQCYVIGVNRIGTDGNKIEYIGDSQTIDPMGKILSNAGKSNSTLTICPLNIDNLNIFKEKFPVWKDADDFNITT